MENNQSFEKELTDLINKHSLENGSDTPDFILAKYLISCLEAFNNAQEKRSDWYIKNWNKLEENTKP